MNIFIGSKLHLAWFTIQPSKSQRTGARIHIDSICACPIVLTRKRRTLINVCKTDKINTVYVFIRRRYIHRVILQTSLSLLPVWHWYPLYPATQVQLYWLTRSLHVPWFWHGLLAHSSMSEKLFLIWINQWQ